MSDPLDQILNSYAAQAGTGAKREVTVADFEKVLESTPLFMRETPKGVDDDNYVLEALRSLVFEGEGDEVATNLKNHGNELYAQKSYADAVKAYTDGLGASPTAPLRLTLLNNRAACHLALKNYGSALKDAGSVIAIGTQEGIEIPRKALFRAGQALVALERWDEARDVVERGMEGADDKAWKGLQQDVEKGAKRVIERRERLRREKEGAIALKEAIQSRGLIVVNTPSPPDNPHPAHFDLTDKSSSDTWTPPPILTPLIYPVFLLYPTYAQSDLVTHFNETTCFNDQLGAMFPSSPGGPNAVPWDERGEFYVSNLVVYVETRHRRLLKCGKDLPLTEVIAKAVKLEDGKAVDGVVMKDGLLSFIVMPKGAAEKAWIEEFKRKRDDR